MNRHTDCPLGDKDCEALDKALADLARVEKLCDDAIDCGLPLKDLMAEIQQRKTLATNLKAKFFPHRL
jgi:hypothetical protein